MVRPHESRTELLTAIGQLQGCTLGYAAFPDGSRPDVLLVNPNNRVIFAGDAKDSETPGNSATCKRLRNYFGWLHGYCSNFNTVIWAMAVDGSANVEGWMALCTILANEVGLPVCSISLAFLDDRDAVVCVVFDKRLRLN